MKTHVTVFVRFGIGFDVEHGRDAGEPAVAVAAADIAEKIADACDAGCFDSVREAARHVGVEADSLGLSGVADIRVDDYDGPGEEPYYYPDGAPV